jgi:hypothetical protein
VQCGNKPNSCAKQLCTALKQYKGVCWLCIMLFISIV